MFKRKAQLLIVGLLFTFCIFAVGPFAPLQVGAASPVFQDTLLGVDFSYLPRGTEVVQDQYLSSAYGVTVVDAEGRLLARVEWLRGTSPIEVSEIASELMRSFPSISVRRSYIVLDGRKATLLSPIPGQVETAVALVTANGRLYRIFYNFESSLGLHVAQRITFIPPKGDLLALGLREAKKGSLRLPAAGLANRCKKTC